MADLKFELVTPDRLVMSDDVYMVVVPGTEGESGILAGHAPYMTTLRDGDIAVYRTAGRPARAHPGDRRLRRGQRARPDRSRGERGRLIALRRVAPALRLRPSAATLRPQITALGQ